MVGVVTSIALPSGYQYLSPPAISHWPGSLTANQTVGVDRSLSVGAHTYRGIVHGIPLKAHCKQGKDYKQPTRGILWTCQKGLVAAGQRAR